MSGVAEIPERPPSALASRCQVMPCSWCRVTFPMISQGRPKCSIHKFPMFVHPMFSLRGRLGRFKVWRRWDAGAPQVGRAGPPPTLKMSVSSGRCPKHGLLEPSCADTCIAFYCAPAHVQSPSSLNVSSSHCSDMSILCGR
jgi:hypothetical protein